MISLKDFYQMICTEFNEGKPLEYRWTRSDGYWKMTKGFPSGPRREVQASDLMKLLQYEKEISVMKDKKQKKAPGKKKNKPYIKYIGD
jgi:hypothetical protein